ncbi:MAG TPA: hypothetical protein PL096_08195 [Micropepsaceae bacterium]|nr:hypothetical protein [Micropepsaceae bacterium]
MTRFRVFCVANDPAILAANLARSPDIAEGRLGLSVLWHRASAAAAYGAAFAQSDAAFGIFTHQDVYLPRGWLARMEGEIAALDRAEPGWRVAGAIGIDADEIHRGRIWDSGLAREIGTHLAAPVFVQSLDEVLLVMPRHAAHLWDAALPGFHLFATDLVLASEMQGRRALAFDNPLIHNTRAVVRLGPDYLAAYRHLGRKWARELPRPTLIAQLSPKRHTLVMFRLRLWYKRVFRKSTYSLTPVDAPQKAAALGYDS